MNDDGADSLEVAVINLMEIGGRLMNFLVILLGCNVQGWEKMFLDVKNSEFFFWNSSSFCHHLVE